MADIVIKPEPKRPEHSLADYVKYYDRIVEVNQWSDGDAARVFMGMLEVGSTVLDDLDTGTAKSWKATKLAIVPQEDMIQLGELRGRGRPPKQHKNVQ